MFMKTPAKKKSYLNLVICINKNDAVDNELKYEDYKNPLINKSYIRH